LFGPAKNVAIRGTDPLHEEGVFQLLELSGVIVIPEETIGFIHNASTYISVERSGAYRFEL